MIDIYELEERHRKYRLKKSLPYTIVTVTVFFTASVLYFLFNYTQKQHDIVVQEVLNSKVETNTTTATAVDTNTTNNSLIESNQTQQQVQQKVQNTKLTLTPSLSFIKDTHSDIPMLYEPNIQKQLPKERIVNLPEPVEEKVVVEVKQPAIRKEQKQLIQQPPTQVEPIVEQPEQKSSISIAKRDESSDINEVIKRFKTNNNPALSLFIAKKYYQIGEYEKAYDYALITNNLNNTIEESWLIFAKSLVKLDKKDKAVETLQKYINHSHSQTAKQLLDEILSGKFK